MPEIFGTIHKKFEKCLIFCFCCFTIRIEEVKRRKLNQEVQMNRQDLEDEYIFNRYLFELSDGSLEFADKFVRSGEALRRFDRENSREM